MASSSSGSSVRGIYIGLDESTLVGMRTATLAELEKARAGRRFLSTSANGKAFTKENMSVSELHGELAEIIQALKVANPTTYGKRYRRVSSSFLNA